MLQAVCGGVNVPLRAPFVSACLSFAALACTGPAGPSVDAAAGEYVRLVLALDRHDPDLNDAYTGPAAEDAGEMPLAAIADRAERLAVTVEGGVTEGARRLFIAAQARAIARRARLRAGARVSIREEAAALGLPMPSFDAARAAGIRRDLDASLPGSENLAGRVARATRAAAIPRTHLDEATRVAIDRCRAGTSAHLRLPENDVEVRYVLDIPWLAHTAYRGDARSRVEFRRDAALSPDRLLELACHETYPGHHAQHLVWDLDLRARRGWIEFAVTPLFTPHGIVAERAASAAAELVAPRSRQPGLPDALDALAPMAVATAADWADGLLGEREAIERLQNELLMPDPGSFLRFVGRFRSQAVAYVTPLEGVDWTSYQALLTSPEQLARGRVR